MFFLNLLPSWQVFFFFFAKQPSPHVLFKSSFDGNPYRFHQPCIRSGTTP
jgi:hypothetical protein